MTTSTHKARAKATLGFIPLPLRLRGLIFEDKLA